MDQNNQRSTNVNILLGSSQDYDINISHMMQIQTEFLGVEMISETLWVSLYEDGKLGCPYCVRLYNNATSTEVSFGLDRLRNLYPVLKEKSGGPFNIALCIPKSSSSYLLKVFPHRDCPNCRQHYAINGPLPFPAQQQHEFRAVSIEDQIIPFPYGPASPVKDVLLFEYSGVFVARGEISLTFATDFVVGRGTKQRSVLNTAMLEALERLALRSSSYEFLRARPTEITNAAELESFCRSGRHLKQFASGNGLLRWVAVTDLITGSQRMVPSQFIFLDSDQEIEAYDEGRLVQSTSVGTAVGGSIQEALYYGIQEQLERHFGIHAWITKCAERWDPEWFYCYAHVCQLLKFFEEHHCSVQLMSTNAVTSITTVWIRIVWADGQLNALGAGIDPVEAVYSGLLEMMTAFINFARITPKQRQRTLALSDKTVVETAEDHILYYLPRERFAHFEFLDDIPYDFRSFRSRQETFRSLHTRGLSHTYETLLNEVKDLGIEVLGINITPSYAEKIHKSLFVTKVLLVNAFRFTYGYKNGLVHPFV